MDIDPAAVMKGTLADLLGIRFVETTADRVVAELDHREALTTVGGSFHGGTLMALADTLGAVATVMNLPTGASTTTLESKTNFFAAARSGTIRAESTPLHRGKRTMVWQTRVTDETGRLLSLTIQTQMVLADTVGGPEMAPHTPDVRRSRGNPGPARPPDACTEAEAQSDKFPCH
jgi:uncharacterized protein (TIGR00369 family)